MSGEAIVAAVDLGDRKRDAFARRSRQRTLVQRAGQAEVALKGGWAIRDEAKHVWHDAELLLDALKQRP